MQLRLDFDMGRNDGLTMPEAWREIPSGGLASVPSLADACQMEACSLGWLQMRRLSARLPGGWLDIQLAAARSGCPPYYALELAAQGDSLWQDGAGLAWPAAGRMVFCDPARCAGCFRIGHLAEAYVLALPQAALPGWAKAALPTGRPALIPADEGLGLALYLQASHARQILAAETGAGAYADSLLHLLEGCLAPWSLARRAGNERHEADYQAAQRLIERNIGNPDLSPRWVAGRLGVSTSYLYKLFNQRRARFADEVRRRRLAQIERDLANPAHASLGVGELAAQAGFFDQSHFTKLFRARHAVTPGEYRAIRLAQSPG